MLGIGVNVAVEPAAFPPELRATAGALGMAPRDVDDVLTRLLAALDRWLAAGPVATLEAFRARDVLAGREVAWSNGAGRAVGVDDKGRLLVDLTGGGRTALDAGEVHLARA